ncbi:hypothetical protein COCSUDRAFT_33209, partial [Coccomyxa subellipsoidea C-169]
MDRTPFLPLALLFSLPQSWLDKPVLLPLTALALHSPILLSSLTERQFCKL